MWVDDRLVRLHTSSMFRKRIGAVMRKATCESCHGAPVAGRAGLYKKLSGSTVASLRSTALLR